MDRLRILTWNVHGGYLASLAHTGHTFYLPVRDDPRNGYGGRPDDATLPDTLVEVPAADVPGLDVDVVLFQSPRHYLEDQHELLSPAQRRLPMVYLEHDPPRVHPSDTRHIVDDSTMLLVHCTRFNALMWDSGRTPVRVVEHGVPDPIVEPRWDLDRGIVVVNDLPTRGRRLGLDLFLAVRDRVPVDLVGIDSESLGGLGTMPHDRLPAALAGYRFYLHPVRYTSLGLTMIEAMLVGLPVVALATTEVPSILRDGRTGLLALDADGLVTAARSLLADAELARRIGDAGRRAARARFGIERFARAWTEVFEEAVARGPLDHAVPGASGALRTAGDLRSAATSSSPDVAAPRPAPASVGDPRSRQPEAIS